MDHIAFERVLSVTSEDKVHCASNLLDVRNAGLKWLSSSELQSGMMEAEFALQQPSCIKSMSVCNFGTAFIELLVGSEDDGPYLTLLPSKMIMTPQESKKGLNRTGLLTVTQEKLSQKAAEGSWDRVLVRCRQPFRRDEQFGLSSLVLSTDPNGPSNAISSSPKTLTLKRGIPKMSSPSFSGDDDYPLLLPPVKKLDEDRDAHSSPSSLLSPPRQSPAMQRLMTRANERRQLQQSAPAKLESLQRQRFLTKEIRPSSCTTSYMETYHQAPAKDKSLDFSRLKHVIAAGEMEDVGRRGHHGWRPRLRATKPGGWLSTRAVGAMTGDKEGLCSGTDVKGTELGEETRLKAKEEESTACVDLTEDVECPLCFLKFPKGVIQVHCDLCLENLQRLTEEGQRERGTSGEDYHDVVILD